LAVSPAVASSPYTVPAVVTTVTLPRLETSRVASDALAAVTLLPTTRESTIVPDADDTDANDPLAAKRPAPIVSWLCTVPEAAFTEAASSTPYTVPEAVRNAFCTTRSLISRLDMPRAPNEAVDAVTLVPTTNASVSWADVAVKDLANNPSSAETVVPTCSAPYSVPTPAVTDAAEIPSVDTIEKACSSPCTVPDEALTNSASSAPYTVPEAVVSEPCTSRALVESDTTSREENDALAARTPPPICNAPYTVPDDMLDVEKEALEDFNVPTCSSPYRVPDAAFTVKASSAPYTVPEADVNELVTSSSEIPKLDTTSVPKDALEAVTLAPMSNAPYKVPALALTSAKDALDAVKLVPISRPLYTVAHAAVTVDASRAPYTVPAALSKFVASKVVSVSPSTTRDANDALAAVTLVPTSKASYTVPEPAVTDVENEPLNALMLAPTCRSPYTVPDADAIDAASSAPYTVLDTAVSALVTSRAAMLSPSTFNVAKDALAAVTLVPTSKAS